jgi:hypothetical protein
MILLKYLHDLIGDFLGMMPLMTELSKQEELHVSIHPEVECLLDLVPKKYGIKLKDRDEASYDKIVEVDIFKVFKLAIERNYYMSKAALAYLNFDMSENPPKAELEFEAVETSAYDYIIAPFSRSLPPEQRWPQEQWQKLTELLPDKLFCIIGHERDDKNFMTGKNIFGMYNEPLIKVISVMKNARKGLISVVSGPSHIAFHISVKNYLLTNQYMAWGNNPEAVTIWNNIPHLKAEELVDILNRE